MLTAPLYAYRLLGWITGCPEKQHAQKVPGKINVEECASFPCKCALWSSGPLSCITAGNYNIFICWRRINLNFTDFFAILASKFEGVEWDLYVCLTVTNGPISQEINDCMCMKFAVLVWHAFAIFSVKAKSIRLAIYSVTTLSSAVLTVKIQLTGEIVTAWQNISLCWKNTLLIALV